MAFRSDFVNGISSHVRAFSFIAKHNLWAYFIFPVCLTIALCFFGVYALSDIGNHWWKYVFDELENFLPKGDAMGNILGFIAFFIGKVLGFFAQWIITFLFLKTIRYIILILCSPIMASLSKRVDEILTGKKTPFIFENFLKDIFRGILVVFRNMFMETICLIGLFVLFCIPVVGWFTLPFVWIIGWYFLGFNMMDYTYERRRMKISQGASFTRRHKGIAIGNGMVYSFLLWIPVLGICLAPILSALAATLATVETMERK